MKALSALLACLCAAAPLPALPADAGGPLLHAVIVCINRPGGKCTVGSKPGGPLVERGNLTCGLPGKVSRITWSFVGRKDGKDVYDFTRHFPLDAGNTTTVTRRVEFSGGLLTLFEDSDQVISIQSPEG